MRHIIPCLLLIACLALSAPVQAEEGGCAPQFRTLADHAVVALEGTGDLDILVITDPLCWHCRLGHKLLGEYPEKYRTMKVLFFPRQSFIGSDMAAWVLEDNAQSADLRAMVDYAYDGLRQPKTRNLAEARMLILFQFTEAFPGLLQGTTLPELADRLKRDHEQHVLDGAALAYAAELPGTPTLVAGQTVLMGYGAGPWLKALDTERNCP